MVENSESVPDVREAHIPLFESLQLRRSDEDSWRPKGPPPWIITFADMITLLLAFFVLLLSYSDINVTRFRDVSGSLQQSLGTQDAVKDVMPPPAQSTLSQDAGAGPASGAVAMQEQLAKDLGTLQKVLSQDLVGRRLELRAENDRLILQVPSQRQITGAVQQETIDMYARIADAQAEIASTVEVREGREAASRATDTAKQLVQLKNALASEIAQGQAQVERDGERIVIRLVVQGSFYSGSAELSQDFLPLLRKIGSSIGKLGGRVTIEGHTDSIPVSNNDRFRSNWDLSGARSAAVADFLTDHGGVARERVAVRGLADTKPLASNATREGRAKNRRIEIIVDAEGP